MLNAFSLFRVLSTVILGATFLSGCSVQPLYDDDGVVKEWGNNRKNRAEGYCNISIAPIPNRDGQKLCSYLRDYMRNISSSKMHLNVDLTLKEKSFALDSVGGAHRILATYIAKVTLIRDSDKKSILDRTFSVSNTYNIARAQGEVMLSLYGRNDFVLLKELAKRITEGVKLGVISSKK